MPPRKSINKKRIEGNPGKRHLDAVKPPPGVPEIPKWLKGEAADEWGRIVPILDSMGVLSRLDRAVIADYCTVWAQLVRVESELADSEAITETRSNNDQMVRHPLWSVANQLRQRFDRKCELLGLAPGPRGRLDVPDKPLEDDGLGILD
jgi:P27 family predicted phage terminase small subunit